MGAETSVEAPPPLPGLVFLSDYGGNWDEFINTVFSIFHRDFVASKPLLDGKPVLCDTRMGDDGKEEGFWHVTTKGPPGARLPDMRRCERIRWIRELIERVPRGQAAYWEEMRARKRRMLVADFEFTFVIVLQPANKTILLITAYFVEYKNLRRDLKRKWEAWKK